MKKSFARSSFSILFINLIAIVIAYYVALLLHEWGHGTAAWLLKQKSSPFDIFYDGWALLNVDENVNYDHLLATQHGVWAAIIGISGIAVSILLLIFSFVLLNRLSIQKNLILFLFLYWFLIINMVPIIQYIPISTFSNEGDIGRFTHGLAISPWWVFGIGTILVIIALWRIFNTEIPRAYTVIPIKNIAGQRIFLFITLCILFLLIYTHGYNPITDKEAGIITKFFAALSIILIPILFFICNPSHVWVKRTCHRLQSISKYSFKK